MSSSKFDNPIGISAEQLASLDSDQAAAIFDQGKGCRCVYSLGHGQATRSCRFCVGQSCDSVGDGAGLSKADREKTQEEGGSMLAVAGPSLIALTITRRIALRLAPTVAGN